MYDDCIVCLLSDIPGQMQIVKRPLDACFAVVDALMSGGWR